MLCTFGNRVGICWLKFGHFQTGANNNQHVPPHRNTVAKRTQRVAPNNVAICCVGMLRSFGRGFTLYYYNNSSKNVTPCLIPLCTDNCTILLLNGFSYHLKSDLKRCGASYERCALSLALKGVESVTSEKSVTLSIPFISD